MPTVTLALPLTAAQDPYNLVYGLSLPAGPTYQLEWSGTGVTVDGSGYYTLSASTTPQSFQYRIYDGVWGAWATVTCHVIPETTLASDLYTVAVGGLLTAGV